jgi:hypothetical protein
MAIGLLRAIPTPYFARDDLESMLWMTVWFTYRYEGGKEICLSPPSLLDDWFTNGRRLRSFEFAFLSMLEGNPTLLFQNLYRTWIRPLALLFHDGAVALANYVGGMGASRKLPNSSAPISPSIVGTAFWQILNPDNLGDFEDACNSPRLGFCPVGT